MLQGSRGLSMSHPSPAGHKCWGVGLHTPLAGAAQMVPTQAREPNSDACPSWALSLPHSEPTSSQLSCLIPGQHLLEGLLGPSTQI